MVAGKRGDGTSNNFLVLLGVIVAIILLTVILSTCTSFFSKNKNSYKSYSELDALIKKLSNQNSDTTESFFIHLDPDEIIFFFNAGSDQAIQISYKPGASSEPTYKENHDKFLYSQEELLNFALKDKSVESATFVLSKPKECGEKACSILCKKNYNAHVLGKNEQGDYVNKWLSGLGIRESMGTTVVLSCEYIGIKTYDQVSTFVRKPFYHLYMGESRKERKGDSRNINMRGELSSLTSYYNGATLFTISNTFYIPELVKKPTFKDKFIFFLSTRTFMVDIDPKDYPVKLMLENMKSILYENPFSEKSEPQELLSNNYVYVQKVDDTIAFCYSHPCLSPTEKLYLSWKSAVKDCLDRGECSLLQSSIKDSSYQELKISKKPEGLQFDFSLLDSQNKITYDAYAFSLKNTGAIIKITLGDKTEIVDNLELDIRESAQYEGSKVLLHTNSGLYEFSNINVLSKQESQTAEINFIFKKID